MMRRLSSFLAAGMLLATAAHSASLGKDGCARLKVEQGELEHAGVRSTMGKGPLWAKNNLEPDKLDQIKRLLEVDEQLLFRCNGRPLVNLPKDPDPDPAAREPGAKAAVGPAVPRAPKAPKAQKKEPGKKAAAVPGEAAPKAPAAAPAGTLPAEKAEGSTDKKGAQKSATAKKAKAKKANDAYRPPATDPGSSPFATKP